MRATVVPAAAATNLINWEASKLRKKQANKTSEKALFGVYSGFMSKQTHQGFLKQWGEVRAKGFKNFYIHTAWRWIVYVAFIQIGIQLVHFIGSLRLPTQEDWIGAVVVAAAFGAVFPPLLWKIRESEYEARTKKARRQQGFKKWYF